MQEHDQNLIVVDAASRGIDDATRFIGDELMRATTRQERFAAVVVMPPNPGSRGRRLANVGDRVRMLKRLRPGLREWCSGLAFVASADMQRDNAKAIRAGAKMWGCPTFSTADRDEARAWAEAQLVN